MGEAVEIPGAPPVNVASLRQQRIAWSVLVGAFLVFCVLCMASAIGVRYFLLDSTVPLQAILTVGRGTVGLTSTDLIEQVVRFSREISNSSVVSTDRQSQATLSFYDPYQSDALVASVTVRSDTVLDVTAMSRPRFELSGLGYEIVLEDLAGRVKVVIPDGLTRPVRATLESGAGNWITLEESGEYFIEMSAGLEAVTNYGGSAAMIAGSGNLTQVVADNQRGLLYPADGKVYVVPAPARLIEAPTFTPETVIESTGSPVQLLQPVWRCYNVADEPPLGSYSLTETDGRDTLHMERGGGARTHGETLCSYSLNAGQGVDVSEFDTLSLDIALKVMSHSLSACGVAGSECPLMVRIDFVPESGGAATSWFHGFYASFDPSLSNPLICPSCTQEHEAVNPGAWYSYQSDNLFSLIPSNLRPASIVNVVLYASGHEYDTHVESAELYGGLVDPQPLSPREAEPIATEPP